MKERSNVLIQKLSVLIKKISNVSWSARFLIFCFCLLQKKRIQKTFGLSYFVRALTSMYIQSSIHLGNNLENIFKIRFHITFDLTGNDLTDCLGEKEAWRPTHFS